MSKKLYLNTHSYGESPIHKISEISAINYNSRIVKPLFIFKNNYLIIDVSENGVVSIYDNLYEYDFLSTHSFVFSNGGNPKFVGLTKINTYYESKLSTDISINNTIIG